MEKLTMKLGDQIGSVVLDIAQQNILKGKPIRAIETYTKSFPGMTREHVISILKNEGVLVKSEDEKHVNFSTDPKDIEENSKLIYDWQKLINDQFDDLDDLRSSMYDCRNKVAQLGYNIYNFDLKEAAKDKLLASMCARSMANEFGTVATSAYQKWADIEEDVMVEDATDAETIMVMTSRFVKLHSELTNKLNKLLPAYQFLLGEKMIERKRFNELIITECFNLIKEFACEGSCYSYHHPICDGAVSNLRKWMVEDMLQQDLFIKYREDGMLPFDIMDGYDAGFLAPDGTFYGALGDTSDLMHMKIADALFEGKLALSDSTEIKSAIARHEDPEYILMKLGYIKIHDANVYGTFRHKKDEDKYEDRKLYCPTPEQIKLIADYIDKYHNGVLYTDYKCNEPVKTSVLRQADEIQLHEMFNRY